MRLNIYRSCRASQPHWAPSLALMVSTLIGCAEHYKRDADTEVYRIIDQKWREDFGTQANYKVSDVPPGQVDIQIEQALPTSGVLTLAQAVSLATARNRDYQTEKEALYLATLALTLERNRFAPQFFGTFDSFYTKDAKEREITFSGEAGFDLLLADGARISAAIASDWLRFLTGSPRESLTSVLSGTITQPLLQGAGRKVVLENLTQAERDALYQLRAFARFRKQFVVDIISAYYRVLQARNEVKNARNNYERLTKAKEQVDMLARAGRLKRFQVDQAEQDQLQGRNNYIQQQERYEGLLDAFKITLSLPTDARIELAQDELDALESTGISDPEFTVDEAVEAALTRRLDLRTAKDQAEDDQRRIVVAANNLAARLDVVGEANVGSPRRVRFGQVEFNDGRYSFGLELDLPLERKAERNEYRRALIALLRRQRNYEQRIDEVKLQVREAYRTLKEAAESYTIQQKSLVLAKTRVESTSLLLQAGRAITRDLLESEAALLQAQNGVIDALVRHTIAKLAFFRDVGVLQVAPDGFWTLPKHDTPP